MIADLSTVKRLLPSTAVLIPSAHGTKRPLYTGWQNTTLNETLSQSYQDELSRSNIGVVVGRPSRGLCSIDIDRDEAVEPFLFLNPRLRTALRTKGARGCNIWVEIIGAHPKGYAIKTNEGEKFGEWRADGMNTIVAGQHPDGHQYSIIIESRPVRILFADIIWPDDLALPWETPLDVKYGDPFKLDKDGEITDINQPYWAGLYQRENVVVYDPDMKEFFQYDRYSGAYEKISSAAIKTAIAERLQDNAATMQRTDAKLGAVVNVLKGQAEQRGAFEEKPHAIHLANCMIQVINDKVITMPFSPSFKSRNQSPIIHDPLAQCPRFLNELILPAVHPEDVEIIQKMIGQILLGRNPSQRFLLLVGLPGRGKTQLIELMRMIAGVHNSYQLRTQYLADRFELFRCLGKTLLTGADVQSDFMQQKGADVLKALVGGDTLSPEGKGSNGDFTIKGDFNVVIGSNSRLKVKLQGDVGAWRRRMLIVKYENTPPKKKIPYFAEMLVREEGSGILNWAIQGLMKLQKELDQYGDIQLTDRQQAVVDSLLSESDSLRHFLKARVVKAPSYNLTTNEIVEAYAEYCPQMGWDPLPITTIHRQIESLMLEEFQSAKSGSVERNGKDQKGFRNVALQGDL
jgi:phage/plasmid-associated DNA primase